VSLADDDVGPITIWNDNGAYVSFARSVFEAGRPRRSLELEELIAPTKVGQGIRRARSGKS
jgi:hypothetical protein